jgi:two-component system, chemotaxis family, response regulator Rcp1
MFEAHTPFEILLVEDSEGDARLTQEAFREGRFAHRMSVVSDGDQALRFLRRQEEYSNAPRPDVILLDLNLPRKDGRELLAELKEDPSLHPIPVIILTTSQAAQDVWGAYRLHANCYLTKPMEVEDFIAKIRALEDFWLTVVRLPGR